MRITDDRATQRRTTALVTTQKLQSGVEWLDGTVLTPHGIVEVMASPRDNYSRVDFVYRGVHYMRTWRGKSFSKLGLARKAREFADGIVAPRPRA